MAYFYVKSGGTATGDAGRYATKQTGSFAALGAANYYASVTAAYAATTAPVAGDVICVSDIHSGLVSTTVTYSPAPAGNSLPVNIWCVSDTDIASTSEASSAQEGSTASYAVQMNPTTSGRMTAYGMYWTSGTSIRFGWHDTITVLTKCTVRTSSAGDYTLYGQYDGSYLELYECTVITDGSVSAYPVYLSGGSTLRMYGGAFATDQTGVNNLIPAVGSNGANGGFDAEFYGVDCTIFTNSLCNISGSGKDPFRAKFVGCNLKATLTSFVGGTLTPSQCIEVYRSGSGSEVEYQYFKQIGGNVVQDDTTFYRDNSTAFPSGQKISLKVSTDAYVQKGYSFNFDCQVRKAALSNASTDTIRVYLLSSDSGLTDQDVYCELLYPDGTSIHVQNYLTTRPDNLLAAGTALTANSDAWTGRTTETRYQIDLDTSGDIGADCIPMVRIHVCKPSIDVYVDSILGVVA